MSKHSLSSRIDQMVWAFNDGDSRRLDVRMMADDAAQLEDAAKDFLDVSRPKDGMAAADYALRRATLESLLRIRG